MLQASSSALYPLISVITDTGKTLLKANLNKGQRELNVSMRKCIDPWAKENFRLATLSSVNQVIHVSFDPSYFPRRNDTSLAVMCKFLSHFALGCSSVAACV